MAEVGDLFFQANVLLVFARYPTPGHTKTRLAAAIGNVAAAQVYRRCVDILFDELVRCPRRYMVAVLLSEASELEQFRQTFPGADAYLAQRSSNDLGERLRGAFDQVFDAGARRAVAIGTDSPTLTRHHIDTAFAALDQRKIVIGPAEDGGYYLIGCKGRHPELFHGIPWSTPAVLKSTIDILQRYGLSYQLLEPLFDVDTIEDLQRLIQQAPHRFGDFAGLKLRDS